MTNNGLVGKNAVFVLSNDIDCDDIDWNTTIGNLTNRFNAKFYGNGYAIENLSFEVSGGYTGLFGVIDSDGSVRDLKIDNAELLTEDYSYCGI